MLVEILFHQLLQEQRRKTCRLKAWDASPWHKPSPPEIIREQNTKQTNKHKYECKATMNDNDKRVVKIARDFLPHYQRSVCGNQDRFHSHPWQRALLPASELT